MMINQTILYVVLMFLFPVQSIKGITPITDGYNPATWMLEVTTSAAEEKLGVDFADIYRNSDQFKYANFLFHKFCEQEFC